MLGAYIVLTAAIGVFHILYKGDLSFIILVLLITLPAVMFIILCVQTRLLKITAVCNSPVMERGGTAVLKIKLKNRSLLPIAACRAAVSYKPLFPAENTREEVCGLTAPIGPRSEETVSVSIVPGHCGVVDISVKSVRVSDLMGLTFLFKRLGYRDSIAVLPNAFPMGAELDNGAVSGAESSVFSASKPGDDPSEIFRLREYRDGDRLNRIHWKLSSRNDSFIVKELSLPVNSKILVLCDFSGCESASAVDSVLDTAMTLSSFFAVNGISAELAAPLGDCTIFTAEVTDSGKLFGAFTELCRSADRLELKLGITEMLTVSEIAALIRNGFSHVLVSVSAVNKAYAEELSRLCGDARLTIFCTEVSPDAESENISAEIVCSTAEALSEKEIILNI